MISRVSRLRAKLCPCGGRLLLLLGHVEVLNRKALLLISLAARVREDASSFSYLPISHFLVIRTMVGPEHHEALKRGISVVDAAELVGFAAALLLVNPEQNGAIKQREKLVLLDRQNLAVLHFQGLFDSERI